MGGSAGFSIIFGLVGFIMFGRLVFGWWKRKRAEKKRLALRERARERERQ